MSFKFYAFNDDEIIAELKKSIVNGKVITSPDELKKYSYSTKISGNHGLAKAIIIAASISDVQATLKIARKYHLPVVTQDKFTSTVIGADAIDGSLILSTAKMDKIIELNTDDAYAVVQPGVINGDLDTAARKHGLFYGPDPASRPQSGIGGNIATNAGGLSGVRYGSR